MAYDKDDGSGCIGGFVAIVVVGSAVIEWLFNLLKSAWTAITNFFSNVWEMFIDVLPIIGFVVGLYIIGIIIIGIIDHIIAYRKRKQQEREQQAYDRSLKGRIEAKKKQVNHSRYSLFEKSKAIKQEQEQEQKNIAQIEDRLNELRHDEEDKKQIKAILENRKKKVKSLGSYLHKLDILIVKIDNINLKYIY